jgi:rSAM/selenodomain-associated transferase 1
MLRDTMTALEGLPDVRRVVLVAPENDGVTRVSRMVSDAWEVIAQQGDDLTGRLTHALDVLSQHGSSAIIVGSDAPLLPAEALGNALEGFSGPDRVLLGPADDGGYYLIGMTTPRPELFRDMPWSTETVAAETRARCATLGLSLTELPATYDVDLPADLDRLRADLKGNAKRARMTARLLKLEARAQR